VTVAFLGQKEVPLTDLHPHPENPNRGDVSAIMESLKNHTQYRAIVANKDGTILAGHHVFYAAQELKMPTIRVDMVDADEKAARKILLADNRIAELGPGPDMEALLEVLMALDNDLEGTGYDDDYIAMLQEMTAGAPTLDDLEREAGGPPGGDDYLARIVLVVDPEVAKEWTEYRKEFDNDSDALYPLLESRVP
jgi:hypothetical protein